METETEYEYEVAISFAGEDREHARTIAALLKEKRIAVFYDEDEQHHMLGKNLVEFLADVYGKRARHCLVLVSKHYAEKEWPSHERRVALERALQDRNADYLIPVRVDDTSLPGFLNTSIGYLDLRRADLKANVDVLTKKLYSTRTKTGVGSLLKALNFHRPATRHASQIQIRNALALLHPDEHGIVRLYFSAGQFRVALRDTLSEALPDLVSRDAELVPIFYEDASGIDSIFILDRQRSSITGHIDDEAEKKLEPYYATTLERIIEAKGWKIHPRFRDHVELSVIQDDYYDHHDLMHYIDTNTDEFGYVHGLILADPVPLSTTLQKTKPAAPKRRRRRE